MSSGEPTTPTPPVTGSSVPPPVTEGPRPTHAASTASTATPSSPASPTAASAPSGSDWPAQAADAIVDVVGKVRDATTGPILTVARGLVYGTAIALLGVTALVLLLVGAIRALDTFIPGEVWSAYLVLGLLLTGAGLFVWSRRRPAGTA